MYYLRFDIMPMDILKILYWLISLLWVFCLPGFLQCYSSVLNNYTVEVKLSALKVERNFIYKPGKDWLYSHCPYISFSTTGLLLFVAIDGMR